MIYVFIIAIAIACAMLFTAGRRAKEKTRNKNFNVKFSVLTEEALSDLPNRQKIQNEKNKKFVAEIIRGHYSHDMSNQAKRKAIKNFEKWQEHMNFLFNIATPKTMELRNKYADDNFIFGTFKFTYVQENPYHATSQRPEGWELFYKNGFTDPFPSSHDMDNWAVDTQLVEFFTLNGITPKDSERFVFYEKFHYVNHSMKRGIIQFDLYKKPA